MDIHMAASGTNRGAVKRLLYSCTTNNDGYGYYGRTVLSNAISHCWKDVVKLLLERNDIDMNADRKSVV